jgi:hypothetical protein
MYLLHWILNQFITSFLRVTYEELHLLFQRTVLMYLGQMYNTQPTLGPALVPRKFSSFTACTRPQFSGHLCRGHTSSHLSVHATQSPLVSARSLISLCSLSSPLPSLSCCHAPQQEAPVRCEMLLQVHNVELILPCTLSTPWECSDHLLGCCGPKPPELLAVAHRSVMQAPRVQFSIPGDTDPSTVSKPFPYHAGPKTHMFPSVGPWPNFSRK